uniref:Uncharacterized protein n=1 Tax=Cacopsylla melanoneura TaxID=428564 RepID=A0A8D9A3V9_9HEMI
MSPCQTVSYKRLSLLRFTVPPVLRFHLNPRKKNQSYISMLFLQLFSSFNLLGNAMISEVCRKKKLTSEFVPPKLISALKRRDHIGPDSATTTTNFEKFHIPGPSSWEM